MATMVGAGSSVSLQISAHWWPDEQETAALVAQAAEQLEVPASAVTVTVGQAEVHRVTLVARGEGDDEIELTSSSSSGYPPYTTILTSPLPPELLPLAREALQGSRDRLFVRFDATLGTDQVLAELDVGAAMADAPSTERHVFLTATQPDVADSAPAVAPPASLPLRITAPVGEPPVRAIVLTGTDESGAPWTETVASDSPAPARLPAAESLQLAVQGDGGKPYHRTTRPDVSGWTIDDAALGVVTVTCEAPGRAEGTVVALEVWYQPVGDGLPDHRSMSLNAPPWSTSWRVASAQNNLDGELVVDVSETSVDGSTVPKHTVRSTSPHVRV
ncbi:hypothetical protein [Streptomyces sp. NPDC060022]|uniref:hypothetical protein n=1 Tax=Streptomyces sp. NPDC060022 TaxID=3347039 RepID=UPI0036BA5C76